MCLDGILWMLQTDGQWKALPEEFGSRQTAWRRRREWTEDGTLERVLELLSERRPDRE